MALPFILGLAIGAGAVYAYNKSDKIKDKGNKLLSSAQDSFQKTKENVSDLKDTFDATKECIKEKKEKLQNEENSLEKDTIEAIK